MTKSQFLNDCTPFLTAGQLLLNKKNTAKSTISAIFHKINISFYTYSKFQVYFDEDMVSSHQLMQVHLVQ